MKIAGPVIVVLLLAAGAWTFMKKSEEKKKAVQVRAIEVQQQAAQDQLSAEKKALNHRKCFEIYYQAEKLIESGDVQELSRFASNALKNYPGSGINEGCHQLSVGLGIIGSNYEKGEMPSDSEIQRAIKIIHSCGKLLTP